MKKVIHKFTWRSHYTGTCGDHYCPGHYSYSVKCSCGWKEKFEYQPDNDRLMMQHRLEFVEKQLEKMGGAK